jgi:hypothetical protein
MLGLSASLLGLGAPATWATAKVESFEGGCHFDATDEFTQPLLPLQTVPGVLRGSGRCTGSFVDSTGQRRQLREAPAQLEARRSGPGGCLGAVNTGRGRLSLPDGAIDFSVSEKFVGAFGADELTGASGGSAHVLLELVDRYDQVGADCVNDSRQVDHFLVQLTSSGISG